MSRRRLGSVRRSPGGMSTLPQKTSGLEDTRIPETAAEQAEILSLLYDISRELTSILDFQQLLRSIATRVKLLVDYDAFAVMLLNSDLKRLQHVFTLRFDERIEVSQTLGLGEGLTGTAVLERKSIRVDRVDNDPRYVHCDLEKNLGEIQSELVIPLIVQDQVLGVLDLESLRPGAFTERHEHMLTTLASTVAIAVENARLYERLRNAEQRKKDDLERAREMQQLLLPDKTPEIPGINIAVRYHPARELGGDFYDFLQCDDQRLLVAVGDVAGKGSAAALLASLGIGILREHAVHEPTPPAAMLADLNGHLLIPGANGRYITLMLAAYDPATSNLILANAGFPLPLLVRNNEIRPIEVTGLPLGLFPDSSYSAVNLQLHPGDILVFCSDGVFDQTNAEQEEFGMERMFAQLREISGFSGAEEVASKVMESVERHASPSGSAEFVDDRTIVVLSRNP